jgi:hypothetical protein
MWAKERIGLQATRPQELSLGRVVSILSGKAEGKALTREKRCWKET